jgi:hypothetical protein
MKNKIFKITVLVGIIGNISVGLSFLVTGNIPMGMAHLSSGIIFMPIYLDLKQDNNDTTGI